MRWKDEELSVFPVLLSFGPIPTVYNSLENFGLQSDISAPSRFDNITKIQIVPISRCLALNCSPAYKILFYFGLIV